MPTRTDSLAYVIFFTCIQPFSLHRTINSLDSVLCAPLTPTYFLDIFIENVYFLPNWKRNYLMQMAAWKVSYRCSIKNLKCSEWALKRLGHEIELKIFGQKWTILGINKNLNWFLNFQNAPLIEMSSLPFPTLLRWKHIYLRYIYLINYFPAFRPFYWLTGDSYYSPVLL